MLFNGGPALDHEEIAYLAAVATGDAGAEEDLSDVAARPGIVRSLAFLMKSARYQAQSVPVTERVVFGKIDSHIPNVECIESDLRRLSAKFERHMAGLSRPDRKLVHNLVPMIKRFHASNSPSRPRHP